MSQWLNEILKQHSELESPENFWRWSALAALSAVVKDNVWLDRQIYKLYPNVYVMLHAESGMKKGPPVSFARNLVLPLKVTRVIGGRSSIQGILKELGSSHTEPGGKIVSGSNAFICSSELTSSIVDDKVATAILTDLFDRQYNVGEWRSLLKMESFKLEKPTITMLTATNEAMSGDFFTRAAIQGGFFARTFIIFEKDHKVNNSLLYPLTNPPNYDSSIAYLRDVSKLVGPFKPLAKLEKDDEYKYRLFRNDREIFFNKPGILYEEWYTEFKGLIKEQETKDETGTMNRFGDSVLKIAMLLSLADKPELIISEASMVEAIAQCEKLLGNVKQTTLGKHGTSTNAALKTAIIFELLNRESHQVSRQILMRKMWMNYTSADEFDEMMNSFHHAGMILTETIGNTTLYKMPEGQAEEFKRLMAGKTKRRES